MEHGIIKLVGLVLSWICIGSTALSELKFETKQLQLKPEVGDLYEDYVFRFKNIGEKVLTVREVRSSCGCTRVELAKRVYQPGETGEIKGRFTFEGRTGYQHETIVLKTDETNSSLIKLSFHLEIPKVVEVKPVFLYWKLNGEGGLKTVSLRLTEEILSEVPSVKSVQDAFVTKIKTIREGMEYQLEVAPVDVTRSSMTPIKLSLPLSTGQTKEVMVYAAVK